MYRRRKLTIEETPWDNKTALFGARFWLIAKGEDNSGARREQKKSTRDPSAVGS
jgi:hypothetical protein